MSFQPPMGLGFQSGEHPGAFGPPPGLPLPGRPGRRHWSVARNLSVVLLAVAVLVLLALLFL
jgi:hypothetical protein